MNQGRGYTSFYSFPAHGMSVPPVDFLIGHFLISLLLLGIIVILPLIMGVALVLVHHK